MNTNFPDRESDSENSLPQFGSIPVLDIRRLSADQLQKLGLAQIAYVKPIVVNGVRAFAIHAADGTPMALAGDQNQAIAAIVQHELLPALVH